MKNLKTNTKDTFQDQIKIFKALLTGSDMAKFSGILLVVISLVAAFISRSNLEQVTPLLIGVIVQIVYIIKYLQLTDIKQKSYTQTSLQSSLLKFKDYMSNRKKYEIFVTVFHLITLITFALSYESLTIVISASIICILLISFLGVLAFKKVDKIILNMENKLPQC